MEKGKMTKKRLGIVLLAVSMMGILFGWVVTAAPPDSPMVDTDVNNVANMALTGSAINQPPSSGSAGPGIADVTKQFMSQQAEQVLATQNSTLMSDLYGLGGLDPTKAIVARHFGGGYCALPFETGDCATDPLLQFGDIKFTSLVSGTAFSGSQANAANAYLANLFVTTAGPLVANLQGNGILGVDTIVNNPDLLKKYSQALSDETLLSIARQSFAEMIAKRTVPGTEAGGQSEMQVMEAEAIKRFMSANWMQMVQNPSTTAAKLQQEAVLMQAYQNWMAYQQYRQMERIEGLLSALVIQNARVSQVVSSTISGGSSSSTSSTSGTNGTSPTPAELEAAQQAAAAAAAAQ